MSIDRYELRDYDHSDLFGVFLAAHALPGSVVFLHATVGCKFKTQLHLAEHDWRRESDRDRIWTGVDDIRLIEGSGRKLIESARLWYERRKPDFAMVGTNATVELSSPDVEDAVAELARTLPCPVVFLPCPGYRGSLHGGYRRVVDTVLGLCDFGRAPEPGNVAIGGYVMDRHEMEHTANLGELRRLLASVGLKPGAFLFGGEPYRTLMPSLAAAQTVALLPAARGLEARLAERAPDRRVVSTVLPVGLEGTRQFLRDVAGTAGADAAVVEAFIDREMGKVVPLLRLAARTLAGAPVAVFLPTDLAAAVSAFVADLGGDVSFVALQDTEDASRERFLQSFRRLAPAGSPDPAVVLEGASRNEELRAYDASPLGREAATRPPLVIGSSVQYSALAHTGARVLEMGYPCYRKHWIYPVPYMGFNGAVGLAQRLMDGATGGVL